MTALFSERAAAAAGEPLLAVIASRTVADGAAFPELQADGATVLRRDGRLVTASGRPVAAVTSVYLPGLLKRHSRLSHNFLSALCFMEAITSDRLK